MKDEYDGQGTSSSRWDDMRTAARFMSTVESFVGIDHVNLTLQEDNEAVEKC